MTNGQLRVVREQTLNLRKLYFEELQLPNLDPLSGLFAGIDTSTTQVEDLPEHHTQAIIERLSKLGSPQERFAKIMYEHVIEAENEQGAILRLNQPVLAIPKLNIFEWATPEYIGYSTSRFAVKLPNSDVFQPMKSLEESQPFRDAVLQLATHPRELGIHVNYEEYAFDSMFNPILKNGFFVVKSNSDILVTTGEWSIVSETNAGYCRLLKTDMGDYFAMYDASPNNLCNIGYSADKECLSPSANKQILHTDDLKEVRYFLAGVAGSEALFAELNAKLQSEPSDTATLSSSHSPQLG